jgi:hypothetical protein
MRRHILIFCRHNTPPDRLAMARLAVYPTLVVLYLAGDNKEQQEAGNLCQGGNQGQIFNLRVFAGGQECKEPKVPGGTRFFLAFVRWDESLGQYLSPAGLGGSGGENSWRNVEFVCNIQASESVYI